MLTNTRLSMTLLAALSLFVLAGCGGDGDGGTNPPPSSGDDFTQETAVAQAQVAGPQAVALVQSMDSMAGGVGLKTGTYAYNAANQRWEYQYDYSMSGYTYSWFYTVQYLDASGNPQEDAAGAASIRHTLDGTGEYSLNNGGYQIEYLYVYAYDTTISGLGSDTHVLDGTGSVEIDYSYNAGGQVQSADYVMNWETLGDGVSFPTNGCPTGTIRYDMNPYHYDVVFDGSGTAVGTLYDASGNVVASGGGSYPLGCMTN